MRESAWRAGPIRVLAERKSAIESGAARSSRISGFAHAISSSSIADEDRERPGVAAEGSLASKARRAFFARRRQRHAAVYGRLGIQAARAARERRPVVGTHGHVLVIVRTAVSQVFTRAHRAESSRRYATTQVSKSSICNRMPRNLSSSGQLLQRHRLVLCAAHRRKGRSKAI
jgi:hypothetical protein